MPASLDPEPTSAIPPMLADIFRQPRVLGDVVSRTGEIAAFAAQRLRPAEGRRCVLFGSGDGWFAARAATSATGLAEARSGLDFTLNVAPDLGPTDRVLAISMSGNVDRTLEGATLARASGAGMQCK